MKAVVAAFNQEKALVGAFSVLTNLRMELFQALVLRPQTYWDTSSLRIGSTAGTGNCTVQGPGNRAVNEPLRSFTVPGEGLLLVKSAYYLSQLRIYIKTLC